MRLPARPQKMCTQLCVVLLLLCLEAPDAGPGRAGLSGGCFSDQSSEGLPRQCQCTSGMAVLVCFTLKSPLQDSRVPGVLISCCCHNKSTQTQRLKNHTYLSFCSSHRPAVQQVQLSLTEPKSRWLSAGHLCGGAGENLLPG